MRNSIAALMAATLLAGNALAAGSASPPLAAGKPAGLRPAQDANDDTLLYVVGLAAVGAGIAVLASGGSNNHVSPATTPSTQ